MKKLSTVSGVWRRTALTAGAAALALTLAACSGGAEPGEGSGGGEGDASAYKVGVLVGLTGSYAALGEPENNAIELYFEQLNADGGIDGHPVELVVLDSGSTESTAVNQFRKLAIEENVHAILGPSSSGESIALQTFSKDLTVPTIALASSSAIVEPAENATYMFKQYSGTNESLKAQFEFAAAEGWTKIGLLHTNDGYGQDPANRIDDVAAEYGIEVTGKEAFDATATEVTAQLGNLEQGDPDAVFVWAVNPANAIVAKSAESIGFEPALFNSPGAGSAAYIENAGAAGEGTYLQGSVVLAPDSLTEDSPQFDATRALVDGYQEAYGEAAGQYAANGWDGATLLVNAIEKAGVPDPSDVQAARDAIRDALENDTQAVVGVNGIYTYTPEFHGSTSLEGLAVLRVTGGEFEVVKTY
ncbi:ABC transporter substrate-binding protein [Microbacterium aerolatum]|uniref:ABC transporter substrate-binding protein n=1 Tax=Microbacterium aerolatum TaxID=153731 RepID=UPI0020013599|nr:ABC transporter substrate-binding protein [Microbacterium aerolatum]MCK3769486.1 ABC transporter substrate-binding protein [Microbacterium aerolatum]